MADFFKGDCKKCASNKTILQHYYHANFLVCALAQNYLKFLRQNVFPTVVKAFFIFFFLKYAKIDGLTCNRKIQPVADHQNRRSQTTSSKFGKKTVRYYFKFSKEMYKTKNCNCKRRHFYENKCPSFFYQRYLHHQQQLSLYCKCVFSTDQGKSCKQETLSNLLMNHQKIHAFIAMQKKDTIKSHEFLLLNILWFSQ